jgi:hypothetical protein
MPVWSQDRLPGDQHVDLLIGTGQLAQRRTRRYRLDTGDPQLQAQRPARTERQQLIVDRVNALAKQQPQPNSGREVGDRGGVRPRERTLLSGRGWSPRPSPDPFAEIVQCPPAEAHRRAAEPRHRQQRGERQHDHER